MELWLSIRSFLRLLLRMTTYVFSASDPTLALPRGKVKIGRIVEEVRLLRWVVS